MTQTPDDDAWLEQIRCPRYFDFEAALTIPCPNGGDTNPPLRDSVYESDDETREFFQNLETDYSLHETPHPQENSPPRAEYRNLRPVYRHRPATSFEEYLQSFKNSESSPSRDFRSLVPQDTDLKHQTPTRPVAKTSSTPKRYTKEKPSKTPTKANIKPPSLESISTPNSKRTPLAQYGPSFQPVSGGTRKSAPNEPVPLRRRRQPERVTPPITSISSKSTSGGFGRVKSRKAILRSEQADSQSLQPPGTGHDAGNATSPKKTPKSSLSRQKGCPKSEKNEAGVLQEDQDILRMMEEHNRRIEQKQAQNGDRAENDDLDARKTGIANEQAHDRNRGSHDARITVRNESDVPLQKDALQWDQSFGKRDRLKQQKTSVSKGKSASVLTEQRYVRNKGNDLLSRVKANQESQSARNHQQLSSLVQDRKSRSLAVKDGPIREEDSLDELLKSENQRVLEERKKRLPERRKALQIDKTVVLRTAEGHRAENDRQRVPAKVEFTSADEILYAARPTPFETGEAAKVDSRNRRKENSSRKLPVSSKSRQRGFKGFRVKSRLGASQQVSPSPSTAPPLSQKNRIAANMQRRQPYTDKIKASEKQKRLEKRLEEDLQSLLSQHNNRVKGNRRACAMEER